jgi:hypothetical protein
LDFIDVKRNLRHLFSAVHLKPSAECSLSNVALEASNLLPAMVVKLDAQIVNAWHAQQYFILVRQLVWRGHESRNTFHRTSHDEDQRSLLLESGFFAAGADRLDVYPPDVVQEIAAGKVHIRPRIQAADMLPGGRFSLLYHADHGSYGPPSDERRLASGEVHVAYASSRVSCINIIHCFLGRMEGAKLGAWYPVDASPALLPAVADSANSSDADAIPLRALRLAWQHGLGRFIGVR